MKDTPNQRLLRVVGFDTLRATGVSFVGRYGGDHLDPDCIELDVLPPDRLRLRVYSLGPRQPEHIDPVLLCDAVISPNGPVNGAPVTALCPTCGDHPQLREECATCTGSGFAPGQYALQLGGARVVLSQSRPFPIGIDAGYPIGCPATTQSTQARVGLERIFMAMEDDPQGRAAVLKAVRTLWDDLRAKLDPPKKEPSNG